MDLEKRDKAEALANQCLTKLEGVADDLIAHIEGLTVEPEEMIFHHLQAKVQEKYGQVGHLSVGIMILAMSCFNYSRGKLNEDDFQTIRQNLVEVVEQFLDLTPPVETGEQ